MHYTEFTNRYNTAYRHGSTSADPLPLLMKMAAGSSTNSVKNTARGTAITGSGTAGSSAAASVEPGQSSRIGTLGTKGGFRASSGRPLVSPEEMAALRIKLENMDKERATDYAKAKAQEEAQKMQKSYQEWSDKVREEYWKQMREQEAARPRQQVYQDAFNFK